MDKVLVTGATGFVGHHVMEVFSRQTQVQTVGVSSKDYDLTNPSDVDRMFRNIKPDFVVHLAAKSGGILTNKRRPADYFHQNILLLTHMFHACVTHKPKNLLVPMGGCSYPAKASSPIVEEDMWNGYPQMESAGYSVAKKMSLVLQEVYQRQHGLKSTVVIPGNLYGEYDNYNLEDSHVIPAMIRKFHAAKTEGASSLTFWGTGTPARDFVYAHDVAELFPYFLFNYGGSSPVNISSGLSVTIKDLAQRIADKVGFTGEIFWDANYPDGQMVKIFSVERLHASGKACPTSLDEGLQRTIEWYRANFPDGIRL